MFAGMVPAAPNGLASVVGAMSNVRKRSFMDSCDDGGNLPLTGDENLEREISDLELEAAAEDPIRAVPTLFHLTYCFSCPS